MTETAMSGPEAGEQFESAARFGFEDAMLRRLRYHLVRLTVVGLTRRDVDELAELARLAFAESGVAPQATKVARRADASPLGVAIAEIVGAAAAGVGGPVRTAPVLLGAVLGAYTAVAQAGEGDQASVAIAGAVGGAVAASVGGFVQANIDEIGATEYLSAE